MSAWVQNILRKQRCTALYHPYLQPARCGKFEFAKIISIDRGYRTVPLRMKQLGRPTQTFSSVWRDIFVPLYKSCGPLMCEVDAISHSRKKDAVDTMVSRIMLLGELIEIVLSSPNPSRRSEHGKPQFTPQSRCNSCRSPVTMLHGNCVQPQLSDFEVTDL